MKENTSKDEQKKLIREKCIAANPEIVELQFGCEIKTEHWWPRPLGNEDIYGHNGKRYVEWENGKAVEVEKVLGRPIRLADVLLAIENKYGIETRIFINGFDGGFYSLGGENGEGGLSFSGTRWNLRADDLTKQSPETIQFLANLLS